MIRLSNGHCFEYVTASGTLELGGQQRSLKKKWREKDKLRATLVALLFLFR